VVYRLQLPESLSVVHNVFHVSQLKKCLRIPDRTIYVVDVNLELDLTYSEHPIRVLDQKYRIKRKRTLKFYKVQCVAELPELFLLKCLSPALEARPHLNGNNPSIPRI
jgi:hypothetical protein